VIDPDQKLLGLVNTHYYYEYDLRTGKDHVFSLVDNHKLLPGEPGSLLQRRMKELTLGYYEVSRYLLFNNRKFKKGNVAMKGN
jgi:hypothetical protein